MPAPTFPIYRVGRIDTPNGIGGLWYDKDGHWTGDIRQIDGLLNQDLPMPFDREIAEGKWISAVNHLPSLAAWFPVEDVETLSNHERCLWSLFVTSYRSVPGHILFQEKAVVEAHPISINLYRAVLPSTSKELQHA